MPTFEATIPHAPAEIDLEQWLFTLSDGDYQRASRQHRAAGTYVEGGRRGMVNVEVMGHALVVQHYLEVAASRGHVQMHSARSRAYLMHVWPVPVSVRWTMAITPTTDGRSTFSCTVDVGMSRVLRILARMTGVTSAIRRHTREETAGFAADIANKVEAGRLGSGRHQDDDGGAPAGAGTPSA